MKVIIYLFCLVAIITLNSKVKAQTELQDIPLTSEQIAQEKHNLLFMTNLAMRGVSSNNAEQDMRKNKQFCDDLDFTVAKGLFTPSGYEGITCNKNTLGLGFAHSNHKDFSVWDIAAVGYNFELKSHEYRKTIKLTPQDFTDTLNLQFISKKQEFGEIRGEKGYDYSYHYQWKLNPAIKVTIITPNNMFIKNEQYPEYIDSIDITREGAIKDVPPKK